MMFFLLIILILINNQKIEWNTDGTEYNTLTVDGNERKFLLYYPKSWDKKSKIPLWVVLHGQSRNAKDFFGDTDFSYVAEDKGIVVLFAEGHCDFEVMCCWNTGQLKGLLDFDANVNDMKYIDELITEVFNHDQLLDRDELIMFGFSAGAFMAHTYAINTTVHKLHSIISVAGHIGGLSYFWQPPLVFYNPFMWGVLSEHRPNVIMLFGDEDINVKIEGGFDTLGRWDFSLKNDSIFWTIQNGCTYPIHEFYKYDMNEYLKLTYYGEPCDKKVLSVIAKGVYHSLQSWDDPFKNENLEKVDFAKYSGTLAEFCYNLIEHEIKEIPSPQEDPDPEVPTDDCYPIWPFITCGGCSKLYISFFVIVIISLFYF
jgi:poly(3-hydroxybutyrate) depolymerase